MSRFPTDDFINRRTEFRFSGCTVKLDLSLGLFSSAGVDTGSMLLLKSFAKELELDKLRTILDIGCGTGTLGLALASRCPDTEVRCVDRDALAVAFTTHNADLNKLGNVNTDCRLMTEGPHAGPYDLVLSNFPAKAGSSVLKDYLSRSMDLTAAAGRAAVVIVYTLADECRRLITDTGGKILHEDSSKQHTVFHYNRADGDAAPDPDDAGNLSLTPYIRHHGEFKLKRVRYELDTVWNIGDFDTHSWRIRLMGEMIDESPVKGSMVFWGSGQGHLPAVVVRRKGARIDRLILADRDRLALMTSRHNLEALDAGLPLELETAADPSLISLDESSIDFLLTDLSPVSRSEWTEPLKTMAAAAVKTGGRWAILGRSNDLAAVLRQHRGWTPLADRRTRGWRAVILQRNS